jgi:PAS domain S-box-containing protein
MLTESETGISPFRPETALGENAILRMILDGTASETGHRFFAVLVKHLAEALNTCGAWVTEYAAEPRRLRSLAFWLGNDWVADYEYSLAGTPCERVIDQAQLVYYPDKIIELFPHDQDLPKFGAVSYMGIPLTDLDGRILGHLAVFDTKPFPSEPRYQTLLGIFAGRAAAEFRRLRVDAELQVRELKMRRLLDTAMDAIIEIDAGLRITLVNPAAERLFGCRSAEATDFGDFLTVESRGKLVELFRCIDAMPEGSQQMWIPAGIEARRRTGEIFPAEATLSRSNSSGHPFYTLILRDVQARREAESRIRTLTSETEYLREEVRLLRWDGDIIGESEPIRHAIQEVGQVAPTDATVLILGETGTGKELFARAIHDGSPRRGKPFIAVNCAAIHGNLIESEFFGHEKGAFTGAMGKRDGHFVLANGGTIFLDEVGDLSFELQAKFLRVLQEGEVQPLGSSKSIKINVRVVAATNRDLSSAVREGKFREDLFYRLGVFPIQIPPLRDRGEDIILIATAIIAKTAQKLRRWVEPLSPDESRRLKSYSWPGNVRELQNVIERAIITMTDGRLNLNRALPEIVPAPTAGEVGNGNIGEHVLTNDQFQQFERTNIVRALQTTGWRVAGAKGAACLLGMKPSTLNSRIKALRIERPAML